MKHQWRMSVKLLSKEALRQFLRFRGMSYADLADRAGCSKSLIGLLATGRRTHTGVDVARGIAKALDVPIDALFFARCVYETRRRGSLSQGGVGMSTRVFSLAEASERLAIPIPTLKKIIAQDYEPGEYQYPPLAAKRGRPRGRGYDYLIPEDALADFINLLPDA